MIRYFLVIIALLVCVPSFAAQYYVDANVTSSGDGTSWGTAKKTITEGKNLATNPGDVVYIQPGTYTEKFSLTHSGAQIIPVTYNVSVQGNTLTLPVGTDLSAIDLSAHPDEYYCYVYRSWRANSGVYRITAVNTSTRTVTLSGAHFLTETGAPGDAMSLSAAIGRPIVLKNAAANPFTDRVIIDGTALGTSSMIYIGGYINPYNATPCNWVMIDGLTLQNNGGAAVHLQCSSHTVLMRCTIRDTSGVGTLYNGNDINAAVYNIARSNVYYNTSNEGIYNGAGGHDIERNHTHFTHILDNEFYSTGSHKYENAIDWKEHNYGGVIAGNYIHNTTLLTGGNGIIDVQYLARDVCIYNNRIYNVAGSNGRYLLNVYDRTTNIFVFNNRIAHTTQANDGTYAFRLRGDQTHNNLIAYNTIHNTARGILFEDYHSSPAPNGVTVCNNILSAIRSTSQTFEDWYSNNPGGKFVVTNNFCTVNPNHSRYTVPAALVGNPHFEEAANMNFRLTDLSAALIDKAIETTPTISIDADALPRPQLLGNDIGAFEFVPEPGLLLGLGLVVLGITRRLYA